jgi:hypothetical protein
MPARDDFENLDIETMILDSIIEKKEKNDSHSNESC